MKESILRGKRILAVDDEPDVLEVLREEILAACPSCQVDKAATFEQASQMLASYIYDLLILDIMGFKASTSSNGPSSRSSPSPCSQPTPSLPKP